MFVPLLIILITIIIEEQSVSFEIICHVCQWPSSPSALSRTIAQFAKSIPRLLLPRFLDGSSHSPEVNDHVRDFTKLMLFYLKYLSFSMFGSLTQNDFLNIVINWIFSNFFGWLILFFFWVCSLCERPGKVFVVFVMFSICKVVGHLDKV